jgi:RNA polymerase sigma-70 factor (ECF subfamily)
MDDSSRVLVAVAKQGDRHAAEALLAMHLPRLRAFVRLRAGGLVRSKESSSDLVQSVCREVLQDLDHFEFRDEPSFRDWLYSAALRKILDRNRYYRADKRDPDREVHPPPTSEREDERLFEAYRTVSTPSRNAIAREEIERIDAAFDQLPEDYREVITLARIVGVSHAEIARQMDRSEDSVRNLLSRALARLGSLLASKSEI